mgnify:CR=1 FL=1
MFVLGESIRLTVKPVPNPLHYHDDYLPLSERRSCEFAEFVSAWIFVDEEIGGRWTSRCALETRTEFGNVLNDWF